jgi:hypothetical protein
VDVKQLATAAVTRLAVENRCAAVDFCPSCSARSATAAVTVLANQHVVAKQTLALANQRVVAKHLLAVAKLQHVTAAVILAVPRRNLAC